MSAKKLLNENNMQKPGITLLRSLIRKDSGENFKNRPFSAVIPSSSNLLKKYVIFDDEIKDGSIGEIFCDDDADNLTDELRNNDYITYDKKVPIRNSGFR
jgi:hypothetical protein